MTRPPGNARRIIVRRAGRPAVIAAACGAMILGAAGPAEAAAWHRDVYPNQLECTGAYVAQVAQHHRVEDCYIYGRTWVLEWYG